MPKNILFIAAGSTDTQRLGIGEEFNTIRNTWREAGGAGFVLHASLAVSAADLQNELQHFKPCLVHFSGYGKDSAYRPEPLPWLEAATLAELFALVPVECVVLNACYAEAIADALRAHVSWVTGMGGEIMERDVVRFSAGFYHALFSGADYETAFEQGKVQLNPASRRHSPRFTRGVQAPVSVDAVHNLPPRNPDFSGRGRELATLHRALSQDTAPPRVLHGAGGTGKTHLALEYAYRHIGKYSLLWWFHAGDPAALQAGYLELARRLQLVPADARIDTAINAARRRLESGGPSAGGKSGRPWLLIFDNAIDSESLRPWLPRGGAVLITSCNAHWRGLAQSHPLQVLAADEAEALLAAAGQRTGAAELERELEYLPLALAQAAAYLRDAGHTPAAYLALYRKHRQTLPAGSEPLNEIPHSVLSPLAFEAVAQVPGATELLNICAYLAGEDIPLRLFGPDNPACVELFPATLGNAAALDGALLTLTRYALVSLTDTGLSVHRLVQAVTRGADSAALARAVRLVAGVVPMSVANAPENWPLCARLLPHLNSLRDYWLAGMGEEKSFAELLNQLGGYLWTHADYAGATVLYQEAIDILEALHGLEHPNVAIAVNNLGMVMKSQGDLDGARHCYERALQIDEAVFGTKNPKVAIRLNHLGDVLQDQGDLDGALHCFERALKIDKAAFGAVHPKVARDVNNCGMVRQTQDDLDGARDCFERALKIDEAAFGAVHPKVAIRLHNLGSVLQAQGDLNGARDCYERALKIDGIVFGAEHPNVAYHLKKLGLVLQNQGNLNGARNCLARAVRIYEGFLGAEHPNTQAARERLAACGKAGG